MPEELALQQVFRNGTAVHGHEIALLAAAHGMDGTGNQFFSGPRFSVENNIGVRRGSHQHQLIHFLHGGTFADNVTEALTLFDGCAQTDIFLTQMGFTVAQGHFHPLALVDIGNHRLAENRLVRHPHRHIDTVIPLPVVGVLHFEANPVALEDLLGNAPQTGCRPVMQRLVANLAGGIGTGVADQVLVHETNPIIPVDKIDEPFVPLQDGAVQAFTITKFLLRIFQRRYIDDRGDAAAGFTQHPHFDKDGSQGLIAIDDSAFVFGGRRIRRLIGPSGEMIPDDHLTVFRVNKVRPFHSLFDFSAGKSGQFFKFGIGHRDGKVLLDDNRWCTGVAENVPVSVFGGRQISASKGHLVFQMKLVFMELFFRFLFMGDVANDGDSFVIGTSYQSGFVKADVLPHRERIVDGLHLARVKRGFERVDKSNRRALRQHILDAFSQIVHLGPVQFVHLSFETAENMIPADSDDHIRNRIHNRPVRRGFNISARPCHGLPSFQHGLTFWAVSKGRKRAIYCAPSQF